MKSRARITAMMGSLAACMAIGGAIAAQAGTTEQDFQSNPEGNTEYFVGFNVEKSNGQRKVSDIIFYLPYVCRDGNGGPLPTKARKSIKVKSNRKFSATVPAKVLNSRGGDFSKLTMTLKGRLSKDFKKVNGTAEGNLLNQATMKPAHRGGTVPCTTFPWKYKATKGVPVGP